MRVQPRTTTDSPSGQCRQRKNERMDFLTPSRPVRHTPNRARPSQCGTGRIPLATVSLATVSLATVSLATDSLANRTGVRMAGAGQPEFLQRNNRPGTPHPVAAVFMRNRIAREEPAPGRPPVSRAFRHAALIRRRPNFGPTAPSGRRLFRVPVPHSPAFQNGSIPFSNLPPQRDASEARLRVRPSTCEPESGLKH